jgi:hypothetical protein
MKRPTYTLTSLIKKVFRSGERSLPRIEIIERLQECLRANGYELDGDTALTMILHAEHSPVRVGHSEAIIELTYQPHQLHDLAYRFLRDTHSPKKVEQIVPELRRQTQFSWNQVRRMLQLERDPRFVQYRGDQRWFLAEWKVANDRVYNYFRTNGITQISLRSLAYFLEHEAGLSMKEELFLPEMDDRFRLDGDTLFITEEPADALFDLIEIEGPTPVAESAPAPSLLPGENEAAAAGITLPLHEQLSFEEETFMHTLGTQSVTGEVSQMLRQALARLEERNQQMSLDVVTYFQQSNLQAIEELMKEKHKNEQIALGLQQVLALTDEQ